MRTDIRPKKILEERRKAQRLNIPLQIKYKLLTKKRILEEVFCQDISGGGLKLRLKESLTVGQRMEVLLYFPNDPNPVTAKSSVVWCKRRLTKKKGPFFDIGVKHIKINPKDKERFVFLFCEMMINFLLPNLKYLKNEREKKSPTIRDSSKGRI